MFLINSWYLCRYIASAGNNLYVKCPFKIKWSFKYSIQRYWISIYWKYLVSAFKWRNAASSVQCGMLAMWERVNFTKLMYPRYRRKAEKGVPAKNGNHKYFITVTVTPHGAAGRQFLLSSECHNCHINRLSTAAAQDHGWISTRLGGEEERRFSSSGEKEKIQDM